MRFDKWDIAGFGRDAAAALCASDNGGKHHNHLLYVLMASRGITQPDEARAFLDVESIPLHNPSLMADMDKATARIRKAIDAKETIAIYGDYDVDGMTATAMLALWLDANGAKREIYIPERYQEGYGLNIAALDTLRERGADLVVTVDCGITAIAEAQHAKKIGLDIIITDHHECKGDLPEAAAIVDPKREDCPYPFKSLSGAGVVFKLICALEADTHPEELFARYGHLTALGTVADVMPLLGENRKLVSRGLDLINSNPGVGLGKLIGEVSAPTDKVTASTISYVLAPRLNAAGRMADSLLSVELLLSSDAAQAERHVAELCRLNGERRKFEQDILDSALTELGEELSDDPIILVGEGWHQGVTGIVAAKLAERYGLPVIIISIDKDGTGRGSCRSCNSFSIYDALYTCKELFSNFGGHEMAAGITIAAEHIDELKRRVTEFYHSHIADAPAPALKVDFEVEKPEKLLTLEKIEALGKMEPFGRGNPVPCLCITGATLTAVTSVGAGKHSKLIVEKDDFMFDCIFFSVATQDLGAAIGDTVDIAFEPQINEFRNRKRVQLQLAGIRKSI